MIESVTRDAKFVLLAIQEKLDQIKYREHTKSIIFCKAFLRLDLTLH